MTANLRSALKRIVWVSEINARYKTYLVKKVYADTVRYYAGKTSQPKTLPQLDRDKLNIFRRLETHDRHLNIFVLGTDEQQDRSGMLQALERIGHVNCFTRTDGSYGQNDPAPPTQRRQSNTVRLWEMIQQLHQQEKTPDLLIAQTWASVIEPEIFSRTRNSFGTFIINIAMDDRHQYWGSKVDGGWDGTFPLIPHLDLMLTAAPECVEWYQKEGCPALFFPEASDPNIFHPMPELPKLHDVCFVGGRYGVREKIVEALRRSGVRVAAYGSGWDSGRLETKDVPRFFAQSKIVLGVGTIGHCEDFYALKMRDFDGPMSGSLYLTHANPDLDLLYRVGQDIVTYTSIDDCIDKAKWFLEHDDERERIAQSGRVRASTNHTWDKRFADLFDTLRRDQSSPGTFSRPQ